MPANLMCGAILYDMGANSTESIEAYRTLRFHFGFTTNITKKHLIIESPEQMYTRDEG